MENSNNSMNNKAPKNSPNNTMTIKDDIIDQSQEESGWTMYLEDFLPQNNYRELDDSPISSAFESSLISDAGSSINAAKKYLASDHEEINVRFGVNYNRAYCCNRLSFKKRKTKEANLVDEDLEDTATSPISSPKVFNVDKMGVKPQGKSDNNRVNLFEDKGVSSGQVDDDRIQRSNNYEQLACFIQGQNNFTDLKKRGLCLVPLSMIVSYNIG